MSVGLLIRKRGQDRAQGRYVPVATEEVFVQHWVPACRSLGLSWVPLFETGVQVAGDDIEAVLAELRVFEQWLRQAPPPGAKAISDRLQRLIQELSLVSQADDLQDFEVFIG
jgi:hypothetical protein